MALNGLFCADVPLRNYSLTHWTESVSTSSPGLPSHCLVSQLTPTRVTQLRDPYQL